MEIMVEFALLSDDFPLDEVYKIIKLDGKKEKKEKAVFKTISNEDYIRDKECSITYTTGYIKTIDVKEPIEKMINMLQYHEKQIVECIEKFNLQAKFCIVINLTENPIIEFTNKFINMAASLHADIEIDSYVN